MQLQQCMKRAMAAKLMAPVILLCLTKVLCTDALPHTHSTSVHNLPSDLQACTRSFSIVSCKRQGIKGSAVEATALLGDCDASDTGSCQATDGKASAEAPLQTPDAVEWLFMFQLPPGRASLAAVRTNATLLDYLLSRRPHNFDGVRPEVIYAGVVGERNLKQSILPNPDMAQPWDVVTIVRFPPGARMGPDDLGAGVALATYRFQVAPLPLPDKAHADDLCPDTPELLAMEEAEKEKQQDMYNNFHTWHKMMIDSDGSQSLPIMRHPPVSGLNLLKYKPGSLGAPCYQRYLRGVYQLIHGYGGGLLYYGTVVKRAEEPSDTQWDEIAIPIYNNGTAFFNVVLDEAYKGLLALRDASLHDFVNVDINSMYGSLFAIP